MHSSFSKQLVRTCCVPATISGMEHTKISKGAPSFVRAPWAVDELLYRLFTAQGHPAKGVSRRLKSILYFVHLVWPEEGVPLSFSIKVRRRLTVSEGVTTGSWGFAWGK